MKIYLINLDRSPDRLAEMQVEFGAMSVSFERVAGVDANLLADAHRQACCTNGLLSNGTVGCFMSHRLCWQALVESDAPYAAVFEDDMVFSASARHFLSDTSWIPATFDLIKLETYHRDTVLSKVAVMETNGHSLRKLKWDHAGTGAYIISKDCARRLLAQSKPFCVPVDHFMFCAGKGPFGELDILQMSPAICIQQQFIKKSATPSLIQPGRKQRLTLAARIKRETLRPFRKLAHRANAVFMNAFSQEWRGKVPFRF